MPPELDQSKRSSRQYLWINPWIALIAVLNLAIVFFDLTYLSARSVYLQVVPSLVQAYDPVKGVHPYPETQRYLTRVAALEAQVAQTELASPEVEAALAELRSYSQLLLRTKPFPEDHTAALATIQQNLQARTDTDSSSAAFDRFWSQDYLAQAGWESEIAFWNQQVRLLIAANYYRQVNRFGQEINYFWRIDLPFMIIFAIDFAIRNRAIRQRNPELSWLESALRRWYDLPLLLPFWRWLRVLPVVIRLDQAQLLNLEPLRAEARRDFAIGFAKDVAELVGIQAIDQVQFAIRRGDVMQWLLYPEMRREYVQVNEQNEVQAVITRLADIIVRQVLPQIQPEVEILIQHSLRHVLFDQLPGYQQLKRVPGMRNLQNQTAGRLTRNFSESAYQSLIQIWDDPEVAEVTAQLTQSFREALAVELRKKHNTQEIENLIVDLLEEIKINYIKGISEVGIEQIVDEAGQLHYRVKT